MDKPTDLKQRLIDLADDLCDIVGTLSCLQDDVESARQTLKDISREKEDDEGSEVRSATGVVGGVRTYF